MRRSARGPHDPVPRNFRPQRRVVGADVADPSASGNSAHIAERVNLEVRAAPSHNTTSSGALARGMDVSRSSAEQLDRLPDDGERLAGRAGVVVHPNREGLQNWAGGRSPSLLLLSFERALLPLVARGPTRAAGRPGGASRFYGAWGEGNGAAAEHEEGDLVLRSFNRCGRRSAYRRKVVSCGGDSSLPLRP